MVTCGIVSACFCVVRPAGVPLSHEYSFKFIGWVGPCAGGVIESLDKARLGTHETTYETSLLGTSPLGT
jgi:hypothetical protein